MGVEIYDSIQQDNKILFIFKLTGVDMNKYGNFIRIAYDDLFLYDNIFNDLVQKKYAIAGKNKIEMNFSYPLYNNDSIKDREKRLAHHISYCGHLFNKKLNQSVNGVPIRSIKGFNYIGLENDTKQRQIDVSFIQKIVNDSLIVDNKKDDDESEYIAPQDASFLDKNEISFNINVVNEEKGKEKEKVKENEDEEDEEFEVNTNKNK